MSSKGFTIIEVLVALALLSIAGTGIGYVFNATAKMDKRSYDYMRALELLQNEAETIRAHQSIPWQDSIWVGDLNAKVILTRTVLDTNAIDSMAIEFDWAEEDVAQLYKRPREIRLIAWRYVESDENYWPLEEMVGSPGSINVASLPKIMDITVLQEGIK